MSNYTLNPSPEKSVKVYGRALRISQKSSQIICKAIRGMPLNKGIALLEAVNIREASFEGKFYSNTTAAILGLLKSALANAEFKDLPADRLFINASVHDGFTFYTPRRVKARGQKRKVCHVQIVCMLR